MIKLQDAQAAQGSQDGGDGDDFAVFHKGQEGEVDGVFLDDAQPHDAG